MIMMVGCCKSGVHSEGSTLVSKYDLSFDGMIMMVGCGKSGVHSEGATLVSKPKCVKMMSTLNETEAEDWSGRLSPSVLHGLGAPD